MKKVLLLIAATCTLSGVSMAHTSPLHPTKVISVLDFGAKPNDGKDDTKALRKAEGGCRCACYARRVRALQLRRGGYLIRAYGKRRRACQQKRAFSLVSR